MMLYTIKKSGHYSTLCWRPRLRRTALRGFAQFTPSCLYSIPHQSNWNKLTGFTLGLPDDSVRIGWRCSGGVIQVGPYIHQNGARLNVPEWTHVDINEEFEWSIERLTLPYGGAAFAITAAHSTWIHTFPRQLPYWGWMMHPYFGGSTAAPHDIHIMLTIL